MVAKLRRSNAAPLRVVKRRDGPQPLKVYVHRESVMEKCGLVGVSGRDRSRMVAASADALNPGLEAVEIDVYDRSGEEGKHLAEDKAADNRYAQGTAELGADTRAEGERHGAKKSGHGGHHDGPETQQASLVNRIDRILPSLALDLNGKINHQNGVLLDEADEENDADKRDDVQIRLDELNREERADASRRNGGKNGDGMNKTFVKDAENDVNSGESGDDQNQLVGERILVSLSGALKRGVNRGRNTKLAPGGFNVIDGGAK